MSVLAVFFFGGGGKEKCFSEQKDISYERGRAGVVLNSGSSIAVSLRRARIVCLVLFFLKVMFKLFACQFVQINF